MRTWARAFMDLRCGSCGDWVYQGHAVLWFFGPFPRRARCAKCAGEPVPADLPPLVPALKIAPTALIRFTNNSLPLDWKQKQAGDREPGEDDA